jgi:hypothetical protein
MLWIKEIMVVKNVAAHTWDLYCHLVGDGTLLLEYQDCQLLRGERFNLI